jgi:DNA polymerase-3 subunit alpha
MTRDYVHLHLHTHYSVLDGVCQVPPLLERAKELGMKALAITDHGSMFGALDFYLSAEKAGIKPIVGFEAYVAPGSRFEKNTHGIKEAAYHLTLLAKDFTGYQNLSRLCTLGYTEGFYYRPRVDKDILKKYHEGIIALSGCLSGEVSRNLLHSNFEEAETAAREYREIFGEENFFLEIMNNGLADQAKILEPMDALSKKLGIPLVATSDVHYLKPEHAKVQEVMICINTGKRLDDENRMKMESDEFYLKGAEQMYLAFPGREAACERTLEIASRCNLDLNRDDMIGKFHLPVIAPPGGGTPEEYLHDLSLLGLKERYGDPLPEEVLARYKKEYDVITQMGFPSYFLMVWEIVNFAKTNGIPVGPGRGSAAGSIISYALKITDLDPLKFDLLFERFLNEGRNEMPDIDLDFDKERRHEVVDFIIDHYGHEQCAQIVTFGKISAKSAVRDVGRVLGVPLHEVDVIAKMVPDMLKAKGDKTTIDVAMELNPDLKELYNKDPQVKELLDMAGALDGVIRQTGIHAAGVLVSDKPLTEYGPLAKRGDDVTFQYDMKKIERLGLCKVDVLGLETLTLLRKAVDNVRLNVGVEIDINNIPIDDKPTYDMLSRGDAKGVFQFESGGMRDLLAKLKPDRFEDLIAAVAMYRPGPMQFIDPYIQRKHGREKPDYLHPLMESIVGETFGLIIYQEQVQALAQELAHFTLSEGDLMRRAMGKKIAAIMQEYKSKFVKQANDTVGSKIAEQIFDNVEKFASYGFNKSHSACYAMVAYQTAYMKCHYPREYMAALLTTNRGDTKKVVEYIEDARHMGIEVLPPDINESGAYFTVRGDNIRFGLSAVKGVGDKAVEGMAQEREQKGFFKSLHDFCERVDLHLLNKGTIEALIKAGAFDSLGGHRAQYIAGVESALTSGNAAQKDRATGQMGLFGGVVEEAEPALPNVPAWSDQQMLAMEKEVLGFYVSSHPLAQHEKMLKAFASASTAELYNLEDQSSATVGGLIQTIRLKTDKNNNRYAQLTFEDMHGAVGVMIFNKTYERVKDLLKEDAIVFIQGKVDRRRDEPSILADEVIPLEEAEERLTRVAIISVDGGNFSAEQNESLRKLLMAHRGDKPVLFDIRTRNNCRVLVRAGREYGVKPSRHLSTDVEKLLGTGRFACSARMAV